MEKAVDRSQGVPLRTSAQLHPMIHQAAIDTAPPTVAFVAGAPHARLRNFSAQAIVDQGIDYTIIGGRFSPSHGIDLASQNVSLSVAGTHGFQFSVLPGSFRKTGLGGYVASEKCGLSKTEILLQPFSSGDWAYSVGVEGFVPGSKSVTVSLRIGSQAATGSAKVYEF